MDGSKVVGMLAEELLQVSAESTHLQQGCYLQFQMTWSGESISAAVVLIHACDA